MSMFLRVATRILRLMIAVANTNIMRKHRSKTMATIIHSVLFCPDVLTLCNKRHSTSFVISDILRRILAYSDASVVGSMGVTGTVWVGVSFL